MSIEFITAGGVAEFWLEFDCGNGVSFALGSFPDGAAHDRYLPLLLRDDVPRQLPQFFVTTVL